MTGPSFNRKEHWENIYATKRMEEVSWYQKEPKVSLNFFEEYAIPKSAKILDVGGGDSFLVDHLLHLGYTDVSVLDISKKAIEKAKNRLGEKAAKVTWIVSDITNFNTTELYDVWHDRAVFHFLTKSSEVKKYVHLASSSLHKNGFLFMGTFSTDGPTKCSGIEIQQYSEKQLKSTLESRFILKKSFLQNHKTPFDTEQEFLFGLFQKKG